MLLQGGWRWRSRVIPKKNQAGNAQAVVWLCLMSLAWPAPRHPREYNPGAAFEQGIVGWDELRGPRRFVFRALRRTSEKFRSPRNRLCRQGSPAFQLLPCCELTVLLGADFQLWRRCLG